MQGVASVHPVIAAAAQPGTPGFYCGLAQWGEPGILGPRDAGSSPAPAATSFTQQQDQEHMADQFTVQLVEEARKTDEGYFQYVHLVACRLPKNLHEQLNQIVNGPIWDGDVISKALRDELFDYKLAIRVCCKGSTGYTGATYFAHSVNEAIKQIKTGQIAA
jgi:hypothetical protein